MRLTNLEKTTMNVLTSIAPGYADDQIHITSPLPHLLEVKLIGEWTVDITVDVNLDSLYSVEEQICAGVLKVLPQDISQWIGFLSIVKHNTPNDNTIDIVRVNDN